VSKKLEPKICIESLERFFELTAFNKIAGEDFACIQEPIFQVIISQKHSTQKWWFKNLIKKESILHIIQQQNNRE
jgi:hypothetical protein